MNLRRRLWHVAFLGMVCGLAPMAFAQPTVPDPFICMYGHSDDPGATGAFWDIIPPFNVIEGTSTDADFITELRNQGRVYAAHVNNPVAETAAQLYDRWSAPFNNTLGGQLSGGYDAIAIDELHGGYTNGTAHSNAVVSALQQLRQNYPDKGIYAAATWQFGSDSANYSDQLNAVNTYADTLMLETYIREGNPSYGWLGQHSAAYAPKIEATVPGILNKTVYGLYIPQGGFVADDSTDVGFWGHLDEQFHRIKNDPYASTMPGVMFWVYSRSQKDLTPDYVSRLVDHYYVQNNTDYFGDGNTEQLIANPQFETMTDWTLAAGTGGSVQQFDYSSVSIQNDHDSYGQASHGSYGLKMVKGSGNSEASLEISGLDTNMLYTVSAWVMADAPGRHAEVAVRTSDGAYIASKEIDNAGSAPDGYWKWNEWSRITFNFAPTSDTIHVVLSDGPTATGASLYWDFVELEEAYPVSQGQPISMEVVSVDNSGALTGHETQDLVVHTASDWLSAQLTVTLGEPGGIYQDEYGNANPQSPNPAFFPLRPELAFDSYVSNGVLGESVSVAGAVDMGGPPEVVFNEDSISITWWTTDLDDIGDLILSRLTLADGATGTWSFRATAMPVEGPVVTADGFVVHGRLVWELDGDVDADGFVGQADLDIVLSNWGSSPPTDPRADPDGNGLVAQGDLDYILANWGQGLPPGNPVPEPASLALLAMAGSTLLPARRRTGQRRV